MTASINSDRLSTSPSPLGEAELSRRREVESRKKPEVAAIPFDQNSLSLTMKPGGRFDAEAPVLKKPAAASGAQQVNVQAALDSMTGGVEGRSMVSDVHKNDSSGG